MPHPLPLTLAPDAQADVSALVHRSWARCAKLDPQLLADPNPLSQADLSDQIDAHQALLHHAEPSLSALGALAQANHGIAILAAPNGLILHERGNPQFLDKVQRIALRPGVSWAESQRGTNAIGTALFDGRAIRIHGAEHFLTRNQVLSCHAAPIRSATGDILGVLDLSGPADALCSYALALVRQLASGISNQILVGSPLQRLEFHPGRMAVGGAATAILLLDDALRIAGANEAALRALNTDWRLLGTPYTQWIDGTPHPQDTALRRHDGLPLTGRLLRGPQPVGAAPRKPAPPAPSPTAAHALPAPDAMNRPLLAQAVRAVDSQLAVLLQGETGTGKEVMARHIHAASARGTGAFVAINCAALPEHLIESELFGYEAGAFTGARREGARGLLRQAHQGTLFLDEIGDMPLALQTRLLRVLQEREVQPLGSEKRLALDFNLISASHQNLPERVAQGLFRADLYYRLQDIPIELPPLRARPDLARFIADQYARLGGALAADALDALVRHPWPGNYRELLSLLRRLRCLHPQEEPLTAYQLPVPAGHEPGPGSMPLDAPTAGQLHALEQSAIHQALHDCAGNISQAARRLGIHRSTLYRKLKGQP
ncbi:sigma-54-dependent Fis family transcriptional regulator [Castellaniella caeni]|uniref:sigma-54-dependent Fis family transcriptional regulator n=1 Tax=Castellaniella caeni TaxID=266123 RepID=UPI00083090F0|nr:sigma-54-dependent Fis family transcriptional regulator [Castellaniella caeni]